MKKVTTSGLFPIIISFLLCCPFLLLGKNLSIKSKTNNMRLLLDEGGNLFVNGYIGQNADPIETPSKKKLCLTHNGDIKIALSEDSLQIKDELRPGYISGPTQNDFVLYNSASGSQVQPQAIVGTGDPLIDGDLSIAGVENDNTTPVSSVYYADGEGVFTRDATSFEFAYANLNGEGRTEYEGGVEQTNIYYITDHLGSTRMTIDENCDQVEAYSYSAYGITKELAAYSGDATREKFTGKEFDTDGDENGASGVQLAYFGARYYDPEIGSWISPDKAKQFYSRYAYPMNPILITDPDGNIAPLAYIALNMAVSAIIDAGTQIIAIQSGAQEEFHWGSFVASTVAGGLTSGLNTGIAALGKSAGALAARTFGGMVARNLLTGAVDFGVRTAGAAWDAKHYDEVDFGRQVRNIALSSLASTAPNIGTNALNYRANKSWDPVFDQLYDKFHPNLRTPIDVDPPMNVGENIVRELGRKTAGGAIRQTTYEVIIQIDIYYQVKQKDDGTIDLQDLNTDGIEIW